MLKFFIVAVFLAWILWLFYTSFDEAFGPAQNTGSEAAAICADDVAICADGTVVERSGLDCEFASCQ